MEVVSVCVPRSREFGECGAALCLHEFRGSCGSWRCSGRTQNSSTCCWTKISQGNCFPHTRRQLSLHKRRLLSLAVPISLSLKAEEIRPVYRVHQWPTAQWLPQTLTVWLQSPWELLLCVHCSWLQLLPDCTAVGYFFILVLIWKQLFILLLLRSFTTYRMARLQGSSPTGWCMVSCTELTTTIREKWWFMAGQLINWKRRWITLKKWVALSALELVRCPFHVFS